MKPIHTHTFVGVELLISEDDFATHIAECAHTFSLQDSNFCPYCGTAVSLRPSKFVQANISDLLSAINKYLPDNFVLVKHMSNRIFIGCGKVIGNRNQIIFQPLISEDTMESIKDKLKFLLTEYDLYDESSFGFYTIFS